VQGYIGLGELAYAAGDLDQALVHYRQSLSVTQIDDDLPLAMLLFVLAGIAQVKKAQGDAEGALSLVQLVLRYPRTFIGMTEVRAKKLLNELEPKAVASVTSNTKPAATQELQAVIESLLQEG